MIPVYETYFTGREKDYVNQCLDSTWISSKGEFIGKFEHAFAHYIGASYATSVCNGTVALHLALIALGIKPGDEVIVPTLTYVASVNTIVQAGATPVFVDALEATWQMDPEEVRRKITPKTKALMAVHLYGLPCDMDALLKLCQAHDLYLIEDCAEAFGSYYQNQHVGTFGDIATFSFFGNKTITTGEGGMVIAKTEALWEKARHLKNQGISSDREYWHDCVAYNYRMTNICAAIGLAQLEQADNILAKKRQIAHWYQAGLQELPLKLHAETPNTRHAYWMCSILLDMPTDRDRLREHLKLKNIETRPLFYPAHQLPPYAAKNSPMASPSAPFKKGGMSRYPIAESLGSRGINLPSYPGLMQVEVNDICKAIRDFYAI